MSSDFFYITHLPAHQTLDTKINRKFFDILSVNAVNKTHYFNGRYENIYIPLSKINEIGILIDFAKSFLSEKSQDLSTDKLKSGFWFNLMQPGDFTTSHTHDDDSEIYSGVYYLHVPENSGNLILHLANETKVITPRTGQFIFFSPTLKHEVSENKSDEYRLSVAFNFGY